MGFLSYYETPQSLLLDHQNLSLINVYDVKALKKLKESEDICAAYDRYCYNLIRDLAELAVMKFHNPEMAALDERGDSILGLQVIGQIEDQYKYYIKSRKLLEPDAISKIVKMFLPSFTEYTDRASRITLWADERIAFNEKIVSLLAASVRSKNTFWGITPKEANNLALEILDNNLDNFKKIYHKMNANFLTHEGLVFDGRPANLHCICFSEPVVHEYDLLHRTWYNSIINGSLTESVFTYLTVYDVTIISHGNMDKSGNWIMEPTITPNGGKKYDKVEAYIRRLVAEGFKKINVVVCNPGGIRLSPFLMNNPSVHITLHSDYALIS